MDRDDQQIMVHIRQRQQATLEAVCLLMAKYKKEIYTHCLGMLKIVNMEDATRAEEMTTKTFIAALDRLPKYKGEKLNILLRIIATELCRACKPAFQIPDDEEEDQRKGLSERDRMILFLSHNGELTYPEIANILEISDAAARKRGSRANQRLNELKNNVRK